jgi:hypothetical protein
MLDLFDQPPSPDATRRTPRPRGHAAPPGSGPKGETCRTCQHYTRASYHNRVYRKCWLAKPRWTHGPGSDIRAKDPACRLWERADA